MNKITQVQIGGETYSVGDERDIIIRRKDLTKIGGTYNNAYDPSDVNTFINPFWEVTVGGTDFHLNNWTGHIWLRTPLFRVYEGQGFTAADGGAHIMFFTAVDLGTYIGHLPIYPDTPINVPAGAAYASICMPYTPTDLPSGDTVIAMGTCGEWYLENILFEDEPLVYPMISNVSLTAKMTEDGLFAVGSPDVIRGFAHTLFGNILYTNRPTYNDVYPIAIATNGSNADFNCFLGVTITRGSTAGKIFFMWSRQHDGFSIDDITFTRPFEGTVNGIRGMIKDNMLDITYEYNGEVRGNQAFVSPYYQILYNLMENVTGVICQTGSGDNISYYGRGFNRYEDYFRFKKDLGDDSSIINHETRIQDLEDGGGGGGGGGSDFDWSKGKDLLTFGQEYLFAFSNALTNGTAFKVLFTGDSTTDQYHGTPDGLEWIFRECMEKAGITNGTYLNSGVSGYTTSEWAANVMPSDIAAAPTLYVIRIGMNNERVSGGESALAEAFEQALDSALATIRQTLSVRNCSIVLMTPNTSNDDEYHRGISMHKLQNPIVRKLARKYGCGFIDTFRLYYDPGNWAADMYDTLPWGQDLHLHPNGIMNRIIVSKIFEFVTSAAFRKASGGGGGNYEARISALESTTSSQGTTLTTHGSTLSNHESRITTLEQGGGGGGGGETRSIYIRTKDLKKIGGTYMNIYDPNNMDTFILPFYQMNTGGSGVSLDNWNGYIWMRTPLFRVYTGQTFTAGGEGAHILFFTDVDLGTYVGHHAIEPNASITVPAGPVYASICTIYNPSSIPDGETLVATANWGEYYLENIFYEDELVPENVANVTLSAMFKPEGLFAVGSSDVVRGLALTLYGNILYTDRPTQNDVYPIAIATNGSNADFDCFIGVSVTRGSNVGKIFFMWSRHYDGYVSDDLTFEHDFYPSMNGIRGTIVGNVLDITYVYNGEICTNTAHVNNYYQALYDRLEHVTGLTIQTGSAPNVTYYGRGFTRYEDYYRFIRDVSDDSLVSSHGTTLSNHETRISTLEQSGGGGSGSGMTLPLLGSFTTLAELNGLLETLAGTMSIGTASSFRVTCGASVGPFENSLNYAGTLYRTGSETYLHVMMYANASSNVITGRRSTDGWYYKNLGRSVQSLGSIATLSALETALLSMLSSMNTGELTEIQFSNGGHQFGLFTYTGTWNGYIQKTADARCYVHLVCVGNSTGSTQVNIGCLASEGCVWKREGYKEDLAWTLVSNSTGSTEINVNPTNEMLAEIIINNAFCYSIHLTASAIDGYYRSGISSDDNVAILKNGGTYKLMSAFSGGNDYTASTTVRYYRR